MHKYNKKKVDQLSNRGWEGRFKKFLIEKDPCQGEQFAWILMQKMTRNFRKFLDEVYYPMEVEILQPRYHKSNFHINRLITFHHHEWKSWFHVRYWATDVYYVQMEPIHSMMEEMPWYREVREVGCVSPERHSLEELKKLWAPVEKKYGIEIDWSTVVRG